MLTEIKNWWCYASTPPTCRHGVQRDSCVFTLVSAGRRSPTVTEQHRWTAELCSSGLFRTEWWSGASSLKSGRAALLVRDYHYRYVTARKSAVIKYTARDGSRPGQTKMTSFQTK